MREKSEPETCGGFSGGSGISWSLGHWELSEVFDDVKSKNCFKGSTTKFNEMYLI